ncbi:hypothetical protein D3C78_1623410 [compost metagenome]
MPLYSDRVMAVIGDAVIAVMTMSAGSARAICKVVVPESNVAFGCEGRGVAAVVFERFAAKQ